MAAVLSPFKSGPARPFSEDLDDQKRPLNLLRRAANGQYETVSENGDISDELKNEQYATILVKLGDPMFEKHPYDKVAEHRYVKASILYGGSEGAIKAQHLGKFMDSEEGGFNCRRCNGEVMKDERGNELIPCVCQLRLCRECYNESVQEGSICPGCKEPYTLQIDQLRSEHNRKTQDVDQMSSEYRQKTPVHPPRSNAECSIPMERFMQSSKETKNLRETGWDRRGCPPRINVTPNGAGGGSEDGNQSQYSLRSSDKPWRPLTRKMRVAASVLSPYRILILVRAVALAFFLAWRVRHPNHDAMWLWGTSLACEIWLSAWWLLDQLPKINPVSRIVDITVLKEKFEEENQYEVPGIDVFVTTVDPQREPPIVTANTVISILSADYPVDKLVCYVSDDAGSLLVYETLFAAARFARLWAPFCRKHRIELRNPGKYFGSSRDKLRGKTRPDFVRDLRRVTREYLEFKVLINRLPETIRQRSQLFNQPQPANGGGVARSDDGNGHQGRPFVNATWMADGTHWPGTWIHPCPDHSRGDHNGIIQVIGCSLSKEEQTANEDKSPLDFSEVDRRLPLLIYVAREKRPGYDHNRKAGALNALTRASAVISNGPFVLNLNSDHYVYNSQALREGMCFMMDKGGDRVCYVQFPQRFEGVDPSDRYANHNTVFFDVNMCAFDGLQGPMYVGTGCLFRRTALYGFEPPRPKRNPGWFMSWCFPHRKPSRPSADQLPLRSNDANAERLMEVIDFGRFGTTENLLMRLGSSEVLAKSIPVAEVQGLPLANRLSVENGGSSSEVFLDANTMAEAVSVISCGFEERTDWGKRAGWVYDCSTEDIVTGYRMHNRGWRSVYCVGKRDAFRGSAPINLTDRLHQALRWATASVETFFSTNNPLFASSKMKFLQQIAYLNVCIYPFASIFLIAYCFVPALCLFSGQFITQGLSIAFLAYLLAITLTLCLLVVLEIKWSKISLEQWWRGEQFWFIGGTSAHLAAIFQGLLKVIAGVEVSFTVTSKKLRSQDVRDDGEFEEFYAVKWTSLMIPPITILMTNVIAVCVGFGRTIYSVFPQWSWLIGSCFFSFWVVAHLFPFAKGLMGRQGRIPTIVFIWSGLTAITISLLWVAISPPSESRNSPTGGFQFP